MRADHRCVTGSGSIRWGNAECTICNVITTSVSCTTSNMINLMQGLTSMKTKSTCSMFRFGGQRVVCIRNRGIGMNNLSASPLFKMNRIIRRMRAWPYDCTGASWMNECLSEEAPEVVAVRAGRGGTGWVRWGADCLCGVPSHSSRAAQAHKTRISPAL